MARNRLLVIGNGMAGLKFLEEIVALAPDRFDITVVGEEVQPAYNRVLLSPLLAGDIGSDDVRLKPASWYADAGIRLVTGDPVTSLDPQAKSCVLSSGSSLHFDACVLATGSDPIRLGVPGNSLAGVEIFRTASDVARLRAAAQSGAEAVVIGGGLLGIEAAYGLKRAGASVTLVHLMDCLMERQLDAEAGAILKQSLEAKGIRVLLQAETARVAGRERVEALVLKDGREIPAHLVVMAIGIRPRTELARKAGVACNRGILVDDQLATSAPDIYAIGECAEHRGSVYGLVEPAYEQARVAAGAVSGKGSNYTGTVLATNLKVSGVPVYSAGDVAGSGHEQIVLRDGGARSYRKFVVRENRLVGAVLIGDTTDALWYHDLICSGKTISELRASLAFGRAFAEAA